MWALEPSNFGSNSNPPCSHGCPQLPPSYLSAAVLITLLWNKFDKQILPAADVVAGIPGPRCELDTTVLPNGKVLLINGDEEGYSGLGYKPVSVWGGVGPFTWACLLAMANRILEVLCARVCVCTYHL